MAQQARPQLEGRACVLSPEECRAALATLLTRAIVGPAAARGLHHYRGPSGTRGGR